MSCPNCLCELCAVDDDGPPPDGKAPRWNYLDVPVVDGMATLPNGAIIRTTARVVRVPYLMDTARQEAMSA